MIRPRDIVLVVDDSPATLGLLNETLEQAGYTVLIAQSGTAALTLVNRVTPDIVLMDGLMPGLDGFETCRRIKGESQGRIPADNGMAYSIWLFGIGDNHVIRICHMVFPADRVDVDAAMGKRDSSA